MNTQYRKNLKDVATACKNYTDKRFDDFKWELGTHTIDTATDSDVAYQKQAPNGTIGCQIENVGGMSYKSENLAKFDDVSSGDLGGLTRTIINNKITLNGTNTSTIYSNFKLSNAIPTGTYGYYLKITGTITTPNNKVRFFLFETSSDSASNVLGGYITSTSTGTITTTANANYLRINVEETGCTFNNVTIELMLVSGNTTPTTFEPYFDGIRDSAVTSIVANSTLNIPASIQALAGYGWGINDTCCNYIDFENKKFVQKVGRVDLGSLTWNYTTLGSSNVFTASISNFKSAGYSVLPNILCSLYQVITRQQMEGGNVDFSVCVSGGTPQPLIANSNYSDATTFKTAMSGVYLYYELATPVETDISSYITDNDKFLEVEPLGTITFTNTYEQEVPSEITYLTEVAK